MSQQTEVPLVAALFDYVATQKSEERRTAQGELNRFIRWCGRDRAVSFLTPVEIEGYCTTLVGAGNESSSRLAITKKFLIHLFRRGLTTENLAPHAKLRRGGRGLASSRKRREPDSQLQLTSEGYQNVVAELASLKADRLQVVQEIRRAAADKDLSENAPLDAAREKQGHMEARIRELENMLARAVVLQKGHGAATVGSRVTLGSRVVLRHADTDREIPYLLVDSSEADPTNGKLSVASPVGKAVLNHAVGDRVEVTTPRGSAFYLIAKVDS